MIDIREKEESFAGDSAQVVKVQGPLDKWGAARLRLQLLMPVASGCQKLLLDMRRVPYIDSDGIKTLLALKEDWEGVSIELLNANKSIRRALSLTRLDSVFPLVESTVNPVSQ